MYPNPANKSATIDFSFEDKFQPDEVIVYNVEGNIVFRNKISDPTLNTLSIDVSSWVKGTYFVTLVNNEFYCEAKELIVN